MQPRRNEPDVLGGTPVAVLGLMICAAGCGGPAQVGPPLEIGGSTHTFTFTAADEGRLPESWQSDQTGKGEGGAWKVVADASSPSKSNYVLAQTANSPRAVFNLCVATGREYRDVQVTVAFKAVDGKADQGGGLVWRYLDANNYYLCRFNPLENNLRIYKVIAGERKPLAGADVELASGQWHTLTAMMKGELIVCSVDGTQLDVRDGTIGDAGRIGLWTKADARTHFDQLVVTGTTE